MSEVCGSQDRMEALTMLFSNYGRCYGVVFVFDPSFVMKTFSTKEEAEACANSLGSRYYVIEY